jgi:hypothetical protein
MNGKITLITPPDIFENSNKSLLFVNLSLHDQDIVSKWLAGKELNEDINFFVYSGEADVEWLFWAMGASKYKYINIDNPNQILQSLSGYLLSKSNVFYHTTDENLVAIYSHINSNRISEIETFLERALGD